MTHPALHRRALLAGGACLLGLPADAQPTAWPDRPMKLLVPFPAGGPLDLVARMLEQALPARLTRQPLVVENRSGGGGGIAMVEAARAAPDGTTMILTTPGPGAVLQSLVPGITYSTPRDFAAVTVALDTPSALVVRAASPYRTLADVLAAARRDPGKLNYASSGIGGTPHLAAALMNLRADTRMTHVAYRGAAPAQTAILAGEVDFAFLDLSGVAQHIRSGSMRCLAVAAASRNAAVPDVPTVAEAGVPGVEVATWYALLVPAATPRDRVAMLHTAIAAILREPENAPRFESLGFRVLGTSPEEADGFLRNEVAKWAEVIRAADIRPE
jgi:tripartite-type tricarboxylate transporter receptor subunit TctC